MPVTDGVIWGRITDRPRHWLLFLGGYAGLVLLVLMLFFVVGFIEQGRFWSDFLYYEGVMPFLMFTAPAIVSALSVYFGGGLVDSLAIGVVPTVIWGGVVFVGGILSGGQPWMDGFLWVLLIGYAVYGMVMAAIGFGFSIGISFVISKWRGV